MKNQLMYNRIKESQVPLIVLLNKIDLTEQSIVVKKIESCKKEFPNSDVLPISALNKFNLEKVLSKISQLIPEGEAYYPKDTITDKSERFFVQEIIRGKILKHYKKEIPYSVEIEVNEFKKGEGKLHISTVIYVMRESQKRILIGHKGLGIKRIGTEARKDIEKFLDENIYLETLIKVKKN